MNHAPNPAPIRRWIPGHDDSTAFLVGYVALSIVLTLAISLFWLVALVFVHFVFEAIKKHHDGARGTPRIVAWAAWDIKLDLLLLTIAFLLLVYTHVSFGIAGLGALTGGTRSLRLVSLKDLFLAVRIACVRKLDRREIRRRRARAAEVPSERARAERIAAAGWPWRADWTATDKLALFLIGANLAAIGLGFHLAEESPRAVLVLLGDALHPWPPGGPGAGG